MEVITDTFTAALAPSVLGILPDAPLPNHCRRCGQPHDFCKSPISHGVPSIHNIKLPSRAEAITAQYSSPTEYTAAEREYMDAAAVMGNAHF